MMSAVREAVEKPLHHLVAALCVVWFNSLLFVESW